MVPIETIETRGVQGVDLDALTRLVSQIERPRLTGGGETVELPEEIFVVLRKALAAMQAGQSFTILRDDETLTTQMAADLLGVSRPFLIGLLEQGKIPYHKAGTHRRVRLQDLLAYRRVRDAERRKTLDDYFDAVAAAGAYD